jgi:hypothetical protein
VASLVSEEVKLVRHATRRRLASEFRIFASVAQQDPARALKVSQVNGNCIVQKIYMTTDDTEVLKETQINIYFFRFRVLAYDYLNEKVIDDAMYFNFGG